MASSMQSPRKATLPPSASKVEFLRTLGLPSNNASYEAIYDLMKDEAAAARDALTTSYGGHTVSWDSIRETDKHRAILDIYRQAQPRTKPWYEKGRYVDGPNEENWVIRWLLWHVFRYRDNRGQKPAKHGSDKKHGGIVTGYERRVASSYYDPIRDHSAAMV